LEAKDVAAQYQDLDDEGQRQHEGGFITH
jgi:hypothetical protein